MTDVLLVLDATGPWLALGLHDEEGGSRCRRLVERPRGQAEILFDELAALFAQAGTDAGDVARIVAARGPGSFTGIRVTLAVAQGLALGLARPVVGIDVRDVMAEAVRARPDMPSSGDFAVAIEMGRGRLVVQRFVVAPARPPHREGEPLWLTADETDRRIPGDVSLAAPAEAGGPVAAGARWRISLEERLDALARLGAGCDPARSPARPLYLRPPRIGPARRS